MLVLHFASFMIRLIIRLHILCIYGLQHCHFSDFALLYERQQLPGDEFCHFCGLPDWLQKLFEINRIYWSYVLEICLISCWLYRADCLVVFFLTTPCCWCDLSIRRYGYFGDIACWTHPAGAWSWSWTQNVQVSPACMAVDRTTEG